MSSSALDDLIVVIDWLASTKTPTGNVAEALERLRKRAAAKVPMDVRNVDVPDDHGGSYTMGSSRKAEGS